MFALLALGLGPSGGLTRSSTALAGTVRRSRGFYLPFLVRPGTNVLLCIYGISV